MTSTLKLVGQEITIFSKIYSVGDFKNSDNIQFGVDHNEYSTSIKVTSDTYQSLLRDLD